MTRTGGRWRWTRTPQRRSGNASGRRTGFAETSSARADGTHFGARSGQPGATGLTKVEKVITDSLTRADRGDWGSGSAGPPSCAIRLPDVGALFVPAMLLRTRRGQMGVSEEPTQEDFEFPESGDQPHASWVFVSHSAADYEVVRRIMTRFEGSPRFLRLHIANRAQGPAIAAAYRARILHSLSTCGWFVVFVSDASVQSKVVGFEVDWALRNRSRSHMLCLSLDRADRIALNPHLAGVKQINLNSLTGAGNSLFGWLSWKRLEWAMPRPAGLDT